MQITTMAKILKSIRGLLLQLEALVARAWPDLHFNIYAGVAGLTSNHPCIDERPLK